MSTATSSEVEYDAIILVLPAHIVVYVRDLIEDAETVDEAVQSVKRYIGDEIAAAVASGVWYADEWKRFADAVELLLRTYGSYFAVPAWLRDYVRYLLSYDPSQPAMHFIAVVANTTGDGVVMQMGVITDDKGNPQALVTIERPPCNALKQFIVLNDLKYVWLINRAIFYTTGDETKYFIYDVMRTVGCIKSVKTLSEFMP